MADILIKIDDLDELAKLEEVAMGNGLSTNDYATNIVRTWLQNQLRGAYKEYADKSRLKTLTKKIGNPREIPGKIKEDLKNVSE